MVLSSIRQVTGASSMVTVQKKDRSLRLCVDYQRLNAGDAYPMPRIEELIDRVGTATYITTLDLTKGYWQVPVVIEDRTKTAFTTPHGLYQFTRMTFGLQGAPATSQRMVDRLLDGLGQYCSAYMDDAIIFSSHWKTILPESVLKRVQQIRCQSSIVGNKLPIISCQTKE